MTDEELVDAWAMLEPAARRRLSIDTRVFEWLDARDTPIAREWIGLFADAPFAALGLATVSAVAILTATPLVWFVRALM